MLHVRMFFIVRRMADDQFQKVSILRDTPKFPSNY